MQLLLSIRWWAIGRWSALVVYFRSLRVLLNAVRATREHSFFFFQKFLLVCVLTFNTAHATPHIPVDTRGGFFGLVQYSESWLISEALCRVYSPRVVIVRAFCRVYCLQKTLSMIPSCVLSFMLLSLREFNTSTGNCYCSPIGPELRAISHKLHA